MKLKNYIHLDKSINRLFFNTFNLFFKNKKKNFKSKDINNILIIKFLGIGSITRSLRMIHHLRVKFPNSNISFITFKENETFMKIIKPIDNFYLINKENFFALFFDFFKLIFLLRKKKIVLS